MLYILTQHVFGCHPRAAELGVAHLGGQLAPPQTAGDGGSRAAGRTTAATLISCQPAETAQADDVKTVAPKERQKANGRKSALKKMFGWKVRRKV